MARTKKGPVDKKTKRTIIDHIKGKSVLEAYRYCRRCELAIPCSLRFAVLGR